jgi:hypothetical protein
MSFTYVLEGSTSSFQAKVKDAFKGLNLRAIDGALTIDAHLSL